MVAVLKYLKIAVIILLFAYVAILVWLFFYQQKLMFYPSRLNPDEKLNLPGDFTEDFLALSNNTSIHYVVQKVKAPAGVILYFHGNAGCLDSWGELAFTLATQTNHEVWMMDYPGFGKSSPELASNESILLEMGSQLIEKIKLVHPNLPLYLYGRSIGSGIAGTLARTHEVKGLILETPYTSLTDIAAEFFPWVPSALVRFDLNNLRIIESKNNFKTLIIHGTHDEVIPYRFGQKLAQKLADRCEFVTIEGGTHNDLSNHGEYWTRLLKFLKQK